MSKSRVPSPAWTKGEVMATSQIKPDIYWIGVNDRTTDLFEGIWPISREGVSYNSYLIDDEKKAIVDLAKSIKTDEYFDKISEVTDIADIDYVILNHMEPDHTGIVRTLRRLVPHVTIIGSKKTKSMLAEFYGVTENVLAVQDGETLSLGRYQLKFLYAPYVHWPETMVTYEESNRLLFSCDAFGSYGALKGAIFDDECGDLDFYEKEALRYYVNIVAKFSRPVLQAIDKLAGIPVDIIAPSHGLIWRKNPKRIIELYKRWAEYAQGQCETGVTLVYGSMYGNTEMMMNAVAQGVSRAGVSMEVFDGARTHVSYVLPSLWEKKGVIVGAPTYEGSLFPPVEQVLTMAATKRIMGKKLAYFGSFGWGGGALREVRKQTEPLKWDLVDSFTFQGRPTDGDLSNGERFGYDFARQLADS